jgi:hypothetical protein
MSRVEPTELLYGSTAKAADINDTNTSWNSATAAGTIAAVNFREEGMDRRVFAQHVVYSSNRGTNNFKETATAFNVGAASAAMDFGATDYIGPITHSGSSTENVIVGYSLWGEGAIGSTLTAILQVSADAVVWVSVAETSRTKRTRAAARPTGTFAAKTVYVGVGPLYFRILVTGTDATASFQYAVLYAYVLLQ